MDWFPFHVSDLAQDRVAAASSSAFGSWVRMLASCYKHENHGCYEHCSEYSDRQWMSIAGVSVEEVKEVVSARLATWVGDKLYVEGYDHEQQDKATKRSNKGKLAAKTRWENARSNARSNAEERKGEESRGKEEGEEPPARDPSATGTEYVGQKLPTNVDRMIHCMRVAIQRENPDRGPWNDGGSFAKSEARGFLEGFGADPPGEEIQRRIDLFAKDQSMVPWTVKKFVSTYNGIGVEKPKREQYYPHGRPTSIDEIPDMPIIARKRT